MTRCSVCQKRIWMDDYIFFKVIERPGCGLDCNTCAKKPTCDHSFLEKTLIYCKDCCRCVICGGYGVQSEFSTGMHLVEGMIYCTACLSEMRKKKPQPNLHVRWLICAQCNVPSPIACTYCWKCGSKLEPDSRTNDLSPYKIFCTKCRVEVPPWSLYCFKCGTPIPSTNNAPSSVILAPRPQENIASQLKSPTESDARTQPTSVETFPEEVPAKPMIDPIPEEVMKTLQTIALQQPIPLLVLASHHGTAAFEHVQLLKKHGFVRQQGAGPKADLVTTDEFADKFGLSRDVNKMQAELKTDIELHLFPPKDS